MDEAAELEECRRRLRRVMDDADPRRWTGGQAAALVRSFAAIEHLAAAGKTLAAGRAEHTNGWRSGGHRSAEDWLARETGTSVSDAAGVLATASRLGHLPATEQALRSGELSPGQAAAVASASAADRSAEQRMLDDAGRESLSKLRRTAQAVRHSAAGPAVESTAERARIHRSRYFRTWTSSDGACEGRFRLTPDAGARLLAAVATHRKTVFTDARRNGVRDKPDAYDADALLAAITTPAGSPTPVINVRVDRAALLRGHAEAGEVCAIDGIGPIPVTTVRAMAHDAILRALLVDGDQVIDAKAAGRTVTAAQRRAIVERDRCCVVPGCDRDWNLHIHHVVAVEDLGPTQLDNLARVCVFHHDQITHRGATLTGTHPNWSYQPPPLPGAPPPRHAPARDATVAEAHPDLPLPPPGAAPTGDPPMAGTTAGDQSELPFAGP